MGVQVVSTMIDFICCGNTTVSHPRKILHDLLPQQRQREGLRDRGHNSMLPNVGTERSKNTFTKRCLFVLCTISFVLDLSVLAKPPNKALLYDSGSYQLYDRKF